MAALGLPISVTQNCFTSSKTAVVNIEASIIVSQQEKRKTKSVLDFINNSKIESFLAYFMCILNSYVG